MKAWDNLKYNAMSEDNLRSFAAVFLIVATAACALALLIIGLVFLGKWLWPLYALAGAITLITFIKYATTNPNNKENDNG